MKRAIGLGTVLVFAMSVSARAALVLSVGDKVTDDGQTAGLFFGNGGQFKMQVDSPVQSGDSLPGTQFFTFCTALGSTGDTITTTGTYTITGFITPVVGQPFNDDGNILLDTKGVFLFDAWSNGGGSLAHTLANAEAVQLALWLSEGYSATGATSTIQTAGAYTSAVITSAMSTEAFLLSSSSGLGYSSSWSVPASDKVMLLGGAQDMAVYVTMNPNSQQPSSTPEPATLLIWGVGGVAAGAVALHRKRKQRRGRRWSEESRKAILSIFEGG